MNFLEATKLFEEMIAKATSTLYDFTLSQKLDIEHKADKTAVTACDQTIDKVLTEIAQSKGFQVVSEEGEHVLDIVKSGNYITIDPIDGTLGYIEYVNYALENGGIESFGKKDLGARSDFCLLIGIVENGQPIYGAVYNYITKEKIIVSSNIDEIIRENNIRGYSAPNCFYMDQRMGGALENKIELMPEVTSLVQAAFGLKSIYTIINPHINSATVHRVQSAGLWDVMPAAVAARAQNLEILDDNGDPLEFNKYIVLPGNGATVLKGDKFRFVKESLKNIPNTIKKPMDEKRSEFTKISALLLNTDGRLLVVRGKGDDFYKAFGGKVEGSETDLECLNREVMEEGRVNVTKASFYLEPPIIEVQNKPGHYFTAKFYLIEVDGEPQINPEDQTEEFLWISKEDFENNRYNIASALQHYAIPKLIEDGLLK